MKNYIRFLRYFAIGVVLTDCSGGFVVKEPPGNQIMYIRNTVDFTQLSDSAAYIPHPLPILPAKLSFTMKALPFVLVPKSIPGSISVSPIAPMTVGEVTLADPNIEPFDRITKLNFDEDSQKYTCTAKFVGDTRDVIMTAGHCVYSNQSNTWNKSWRAYTKYDTGCFESQFNWDCAAIYTGWAQRSYPFDYAFAARREAE